MERPPRVCKVCGHTEREAAFYRHGRICRPCKRAQVRAAEVKRRLADPEAFVEDQRERLRRSRQQRGVSLTDRQRAKREEGDGSANYFGAHEELDHEKRCHWRFFTVDACTRPVVGGREGWWWCSTHDPQRKRDDEEAET